MMTALRIAIAVTIVGAVCLYIGYHVRAEQGPPGHGTTQQAEERRTECPAGRDGFIDDDGAIFHVELDGATSTTVLCSCEPASKKGVVR